MDVIKTLKSEVANYWPSTTCIAAARITLENELYHFTSLYEDENIKPDKNAEDIIYALREVIHMLKTTETEQIRIQKRMAKAVAKLKKIAGDGFTCPFNPPKAKGKV